MLESSPRATALQADEGGVGVGVGGDGRLIRGHAQKGRQG